MPIHDATGNRLGVLNIDSHNDIDQTRFYDSDFKDAMDLAADAFASLLERKM